MTGILKESEDERTRKEIISALKWADKEKIKNLFSSTRNNNEWEATKNSR